MPAVAGVLLDHVDQDPTQVGLNPAQWTDSPVRAAGVSGAAPAVICRESVDLPPKHSDGINQRVVRAGVHVVVFVRVVVGAIDAWRIGRDEPSLKPVALHLGHVTDEPHDVEIALAARLRFEPARR